MRHGDCAGDSINGGHGQSRVRTDSAQVLAAYKSCGGYFRGDFLRTATKAVTKVEQSSPGYLLANNA
jgi:hypothetical protein